MTTDFDVGFPAVGQPLLGSCHTVPFPPEVSYSFVSASATKGTIVMTALCNGVEQRHAVRPVSPLYDLDNPACSGNLVIPLRQPPGQSAVAIITFCNDSQLDGVITVLAGASVARADKQPKVIIYRQLPAQQSTVVHILFSSPL